MLQLRAPIGGDEASEVRRLFHSLWGTRRAPLQGRDHEPELREV